MKKPEIHPDWMRLHSIEDLADGLQANANGDDVFRQDCIECMRRAVEIASPLLAEALAAIIAFDAVKLPEYRMPAGIRADAIAALQAAGYEVEP